MVLRKKNKQQQQKVILYKEVSEQEMDTVLAGVFSTAWKIWHILEMMSGVSRAPLTQKGF